MHALDISVQSRVANLKGRVVWWDIGFLYVGSYTFYMRISPQCFRFTSSVGRNSGKKINPVSSQDREIEDFVIFQSFMLPCALSRFFSRTKRCTFFFYYCNLFFSVGWLKKKKKKLNGFIQPFLILYLPTISLLLGWGLYILWFCLYITRYIYFFL